MIQNIPESYYKAPREDSAFFVYDFKMTKEVVKPKWQYESLLIINKWKTSNKAKVLLET